MIINIHISKFFVTSVGWLQIRFCLLHPIPCTSLHAFFCASYRERRTAKLSAKSRDFAWLLERVSPYVGTRGQQVVKFRNAGRWVETHHGYLVHLRACLPTTYTETINLCTEKRTKMEMHQSTGSSTLLLKTSLFFPGCSINSRYNSCTHPICFWWSFY